MDHDYDPHLEIGLSQRTRREQRDAPINTNDENDENNYDEYDTRKYESYTASKPLGAEDMFGKSPRAKADDAWHVLTEIDAMHSAMSERDRSPDGKIAAIRRRNKARKLLGGKKSLLHSMSQPTLSSSSSARINNLKHHLNNSVINHALTPSSASSMKSSSSYLRKYNKQRRTKIKNSNAKSAKGIPRMDVGEVESDGDLDMDDDEKDFKAIAEMEEEVPGEKEYRVMLKKMQITEREKDLDQLLPVIQSKDAVSMRKIQQQTRSKFLKKNRAKILNLCEEHHQIEKDKQSMREKQQNNMTDLASEMFWLISLTEKLDSENTKLVKKLNPMEAEEFDIQQQVVMREKQALFLSNLANKYKKELSSAHGTIDKLKGEVNNMWNLNKAQAKAYNEQERHHRDTLLKELTQVRNESELYKKQLAQADTEKRQLLLKVSQLESSVIQLNARAKGVGYL